MSSVFDPEDRSDIFLRNIGLLSKITRHKIKDYSYPYVTSFHDTSHIICLGTEPRNRF
jgi:hypothetical protein